MGTEAAPGGARARDLVAAGLGAALLSAGVATFVVLSAPPENRAAAAVAHGLIVAVPAAVALLALARNARDRYARVLLVTAGLWATTALAESSDATVYSLGRAAVWLVEPSLVFLLVAFPAGRLTDQAARRTVAAAVLVVLLLYVPTALVTDGYPTPSPYTATCGLDCPANALALTASQPDVVDGLVRPAREALSALIFLAATVIVVRRAVAAGPLLRIALVPVAAIAGYRAVTLAGYDLARAIDPRSLGLEVAGWLYLLCLPLLALAFAAGLILRQTRASMAIQRLALRAGGQATPEALRGALGAALDDPTLRILVRGADAGPRWTDDTGAAAVLPPSAADRQVVAVRNFTGRELALVLDGTLAQDPTVVRAAATYALVLLENEGLVGRLRTSLADLALSRTRTIAVADETRRRIEHDLHDGAQQRLIALRLRLAAESQALAGVDRRSADQVAALGEEAERAIQDLRALAHGIYPSVLTDRGLPDALRAVARQTSLPTTVDAGPVGRYPREIETTVYFACLEALQNAEKHALGASRVTIGLHNGVASRLRFRVTDDGAGFDPDGHTDGTGLTGLRDRLGAVGGSLTIASAVGHGTTVSGSVPVTD